MYVSTLTLNLTSVVRDTIDGSSTILRRRNLIRRQLGILSRINEGSGNHILTMIKGSNIRSVIPNHEIRTTSKLVRRMRANITTRNRRRLGLLLITLKGNLRPNVKNSIRPNRRLVNLINIGTSMDLNLAKHTMGVPRRLRRLLRPRPVKRPINVQRMKSRLLNLQTKNRTHSPSTTFHKLRRAVNRLRRNNLTTTIKTRRPCSTTGVRLRVSAIRHNLFLSMCFYRFFANRRLARKILPPLCPDTPAKLPPFPTYDQYYTSSPRGLPQYRKQQRPTIIQSGSCPP